MSNFAFDLTFKDTSSFLLKQHVLGLHIIVLNTHSDKRDLAVRKAYETMPQRAWNPISKMKYNFSYRGQNALQKFTGSSKWE